MKKVLITGLIPMMVAGGVSAQELTIAGFGGKVQEDLASTLWIPSAEQAGIGLRQESHDGIAGVRVQVQSGNPGWDIVHLGADNCAVGAREGLFEPLDYSVIDASGVHEASRGDEWISINSYSVVLGYRTDTYGDNPPKNWVDFWNVEDFPGRRALGVYPQEMMEIGLLGAGVAKEDVYPLDMEKAISSLEKIQPHIGVWWASGAQSAQLIADGEVDMLAIWGSRVTGVINNGAPVAYTYQDGILGSGCLAILKGSDNVEAAQTLISLVVSPEMQAHIPEEMPYYGPANQKAFELTNAPEEVVKASNTAPENAAKQLILDVDWWAKNAAEVQEDYKMMMIQ
ncbi:ABC transporter substrate-binding protein [Roseovarius pelagicus]|uniref:ABC transporter substrate-binding protein n=1 Tax=Roseovarius pelagicus TaxID=2980108 RepID=A0ABY6D6P8_9RHOB|nr:ABC transporter substrate-binding protein [Roseovarius pelagicus]UXX81773.1 ABC transporter substrate-binding protein [Roseovarius pelagicus]